MKNRKQQNRPPSLKRQWAQFSREKREKTPYCEVCHCKDHLQVHHLLCRKLYKEYFLEDLNTIVLCPKHHQFGRQSAHRGIWWFVDWLMRHKPEQFKWVMEHA